MNALYALGETASPPAREPNGTNVAARMYRGYARSRVRILHQTDNTPSGQSAALGRSQVTA